jgi:hypothetical protein
VIDSGKGQWDHVHVEDLADLYSNATVNILMKVGTYQVEKEELFLGETGGTLGWRCPSKLRMRVLQRAKSQRIG